MCEGTPNDQENEPVFSTLPDDERMRALFSSCPASMIDMRVYCQKIAAAEDEKEEHERKKKQATKEKRPFSHLFPCPCFPPFSPCFCKKGSAERHAHTKRDPDCF